MVGGITGYSSYYTYGNAMNYGVTGTGNTQENFSVSGKEADGSVKKVSQEECQTCKSRKYQDGSNENVSFKAAAHISPEAAAGAVRAHEGEHVSNAYTSAAQKNGKVLQASVSIHTSVCPECGKTYVSGGTTSTKIKYPSNPYEENKKILQEEAAKGNNIDYAA